MPFRSSRTPKPTPPSISASAFVFRFRTLVALAWVVPALFGLSFLLFVVKFFTLEELWKILQTAPLPIYVIATQVFADVYFRRLVIPIERHLKEAADGKASMETTAAAQRTARRFPLHFWVHFIVYLALAPVSVVWSAHLGYGFSPSSTDWFRIELVALIVSIIVGLPIFFLIVDLFGVVFADTRIEKPHVTIQVKVFLIAALVPLLIDTMLVQYFWTVTGYFTGGTFVVWLFLEAMALAGAALFVRSFRQSLTPLATALRQGANESPPPLNLRPASTDELGVLTIRYREVLENLDNQSRLLELRNRILRLGGAAKNLADAVVLLIDEARAQVGSDDTALALADERGDLHIVAFGGRYQPESSLRIPHSDAFPAQLARDEHQAVFVSDVQAATNMRNAIAETLDCRSAIYAPLVADGRRLGVLIASYRSPQTQPPDATLRAFETVAKEASAVILRFQLESQLQHAQRMEGVGRLAGGLAHDFNNLLTVIMANATFIVDGLPSDSPLRRDAEELVHHVERASDLTNQLLAFSRRQLMRPQVLDPAAVIRDLGRMLDRLLSSRIVLTLDLRSTGRVRVDRSQLEQVVVNLVVNARDAIDEDGAIDVRSWDDPDTGSVCIAVDDNGPGVPLPLQSRIFEPYFTTKAEGKGTGLGLATVYGIVSQSHGEVSVRSSNAGGASFVVKLPRAEEPESGAPSDATTVPATSGDYSATVLVVDDEAPLRELLVRICESAGYRVLSAENGAAALAIAEQNLDSIDVLISDVIMPGLKGPELARKLLARRPGLGLLLMSGYAAEAILEVEGLDCAVLSKPFTPKDLLAQIRAVLAARNPQPSKSEHR